VIAAGCRGARYDPPRQSSDPLLEKLAQPGVNRPAGRQAAAVAQPRGAPGTQAGMVLLVNGQPVTRALNLEGRLAYKDGVIELLAENQPTVEIHYRLPKGLPALGRVNEQGSVAAVDRSNPGGPARQIIVSAAGAPVLGEVLLKSPHPVSIELGPGLQLRQRAEPAEGLTDVAVELVSKVSDGQPITTGAVTTVKLPGGPIHIYVEASYRLNVPDPTGQYPGGYIFHAWVVRSGA
jgi:hypothetical protein